MTFVVHFSGALLVRMRMSVGGLSSRLGVVERDLEGIILLRLSRGASCARTVRWILISCVLLMRRVASMCIESKDVSPRDLRYLKIQSIYERLLISSI